MNPIYFLIDGENIDATLGVNILKHFPRADERPRWDRVLKFHPWAGRNCPALAQCPAFDGSDNESQESDSQQSTTERSCSGEGTSAQASATRPVPHPGTFTATNAGEQAHHTTSTDVNSADAVNNSEEQTAKTNGLFFLNASQRTAMTFVQALLAIGWNPVLLTSENPELKIVDMGIQRTLDAIAQDRPGADVVLASHDVDYLPQIERLLDRGHRVAIICFREYLATSLAELEDRGLEIIDLEYDVQAFNVPLSRVSPIEIDEFDPYQFI
ncbi:NYN domain-containing protein [Arcanobacterium bovis]|uniref:NYN domain-containing protein n=1 Tax=Arcanobacterium bovis TaxID=2529275 RepID=UPI00168AA971